MRIVKRESHHSFEVYAIYWIDNIKHFFYFPNPEQGISVITENDCKIVDPTISKFVLMKSFDAEDLLIHWALYKIHIETEEDLHEIYLDQIIGEIKNSSYEKFHQKLYDQQQLFHDEVEEPLDEMISLIEDNELIDTESKQKNLYIMQRKIKANSLLYQNKEQLQELLFLYADIYNKNTASLKENPDDFFIWSKDEKYKEAMNIQLQNLKKKIFNNLSYFVER